jgi:hypothetical protein
MHRNAKAVYMDFCHILEPAEPARKIQNPIQIHALHQSTSLKTHLRQNNSYRDTQQVLTQQSLQLVNVPHIRNGLVKPWQQGCVCVDPPTRR